MAQAIWETIIRDWAVKTHDLGTPVTWTDIWNQRLFLFISHTDLIKILLVIKAIYVKYIIFHSASII